MADEAKLCSLIYSTSEALVVPCAAGHCGGESSPFYWPMLALGIVVFGAAHWFAEQLRLHQPNTWFDRPEKFPIIYWINNYSHL